MNRKWFLRLAAGCTVILLARGTVHGAEKKILSDSEEKPAQVEKIPFEPRSFYRSYLVPRMDSRLQGEATAAYEYTNPAANPWTKDHATVERIEASAIRAGKKALKRYVIDSLRIDTWSIPLFEARRANVSSGPAVADTRARLRFGISHLTPRAELSIPATYGRVGLSADARGAVDASFESNSYTFRFGVSYDPRDHRGTFTVGGRF